MILNCMSLVPANSYHRAAMLAIADVERKRARGGHLAEFPYAHAYFRHLKGSKRISIKELRLFAPVLTDRELRGNKTAWLQAIDTLVESRGICCWLPLAENAGRTIFPEVAFQREERQRQHDELLMIKYSRQHRRERSQKERLYQAHVGQAEIELAFHTPETVGSWCSHWSRAEISQYDLEHMLFRWIERFPSLGKLDRWAFQREPFWIVLAEINALAKEAPMSQQTMERWMVPNKLTHRTETA
ncbi:plasmid SOS inhibition protein A [Serratia proteamaculans]|uniref:plasmid SOS inhibition protein A n=1 Tax=Serratia proteamaculans TaxID=28151 RepID=UPI0039BE91AA